MAFPLWAIFALLAAVFWGASNILDKILLSKGVSYENIILAFPIAFPLILPLLFFFDISISWQMALFVTISSAIYSVGLVFYFIGLKQGEVSRLIPLFSITPIFVAVLSAIFLGEIFPSSIYFGILLIVFGAVLVSYEPSGKKKFNTRAISFFILSTLIFSAEMVLLKYLLNFVDYFSLFFFFIVGISLIFPLFFWVKADKPAFFKILKDTKILSLLLLSRITGGIGSLLNIAALSIGFVTIVTSLEETQPFFVLVFASIVAYFFKGIIQEEFTWKNVLQKLVAIALLFAGVLIVT